MARKPLVIAGPSGSGKTFLVERLAERHAFRLVLSSMTRSPRAGEQHLVDNEFLADEQFDAVAKSGDFFMTNSFFGQRYGYRRSFIEAIQEEGGIPAAIVYTPTVDQFFAAYPESFGVYLLPTSLDLLAERMRRRGDTEAEVDKRISGVELEIDAYRQYADLFGLTAQIANDNDINDVIAAITAHYQL